MRLPRSLKTTLFILSGVGFLFFLAACTVQMKAKELTTMRARRVANVIKAHKTDFIQNVPFLGYVEPRRLASLHFLLAGRVANCRLREGARVVAGEEICRLDMTAVNLEVARSLGAMQAAQRVLETNLPEKQKELFEAGVIGQAEFEQVRVQSETGKAQLGDSSKVYEMVLKKQGEHVLRAPWEGTLTRLLAKPGQPIAPEIPAAVFSDEKGFQIRTDLHASYFTKIRTGAIGQIRAISSKRIKSSGNLVVVEKASSITPSTQSFQVALALKDELIPAELTSGIIVSGEIELKRIMGALVIPESSLNTWRQDGSSSVFIVDSEGRLRLKEIKTGAMDKGQVVVEEGLTEQDRVVREIAPDFVNGMAVETQESL